MQNILNQQRLLLSKIREGDFSHAGDIEAIQIMLEKLYKITGHKEINKILDIGCGLGGTASYVKNAIHSDVYAIDIDKAAIKYAKNKYKEIHFYVCDVINAASLFHNIKFDFIYFLNVFYAIEIQQECLLQLNKIATPQTVLTIFDYINLNLSSQHNYRDFSGKKMNLIVPDDFKNWLKKSNWELIGETDLSDQYIVWYKSVIQKLVINKDLLLTTFHRSIYDEVIEFFTKLVSDLENKLIGGAIFYARYNPNKM